jgi:UDP-N-acetylglucosamine 2-epimerase (non-hydrolysing)
MGQAKWTPPTVSAMSPARLAMGRYLGGRGVCSDRDAPPPPYDDVGWPVMTARGGWWDRIGADAQLGPTVDRRWRRVPPIWSSRSSGVLSDGPANDPRERTRPSSISEQRQPGACRDAVVMNGPIVHLVGARPNFMKAAPVVRALHDLGVSQRLVHTGQHYTEALSDVFFRELSLSEPDLNLGVGSGSHAVQTAATMTALESALPGLDPSLLVLYGDVNSTLAGALVAAKMGVPAAHVEAGLRSFDRSMPEEVNRVVVDALAALLFVTSPEAIANLAHEGVPADQIHFVGNPMIDTLLRLRDRFDSESARLRFALPTQYGVVTLHRPANVDSEPAARAAVEAILAVSQRLPLIIPLHPRGRATLEAAGLTDGHEVVIVEPVGYLEFMSLVTGAALVITDSGGVQEETTILGIPCLTLRPNTERPITITNGTNRLVTAAGLPEAAAAAQAGLTQRRNEPPPLWDGRSGQRIADIVAAWTAGELFEASRAS